jgi:hypothetical protein
MDWTLNSPVRNISPCRGRSHSHRAFAHIYHSFSARGTFADKAQVSLKLPSEIIFENLTARAPSDVTCLNWWDTCRVRYGQTRISQWWVVGVIEARDDVHVKSNCTVWHEHAGGFVEEAWKLRRETIWFVHARCRPGTHPFVLSHEKK